MVQAVTNFLQGTVSVAVESASPERVLNLCSAREIAFWDLVWESPTELSFKLTRRDYRRFRQVASALDATLTHRREHGAPVFLRRFRHRYALLFGGAAVALTLLIGSFFIWNFEVTGNETVSEEEILRALEEYGVHLGTVGSSIEQEDLRNHVLLKLPDLSWLAVNVRGCTAHVQVVERLRPPETYVKGAASNVVAARDGLVEKVEALDGVAQVLPGTTVTRGQLLISGVADSEAGGIRLLHGMGAVWARTWYELSVEVPLQKLEKTQIDRKTAAVALIFGKNQIKIGAGGSRMEAGCDKMTVVHPWTLPGGFSLPVALRYETRTYWRCQSVTRTEAEAKDEGKTALLAYLDTLLSEGGSVRRTQFSFAQRDGRVLVTLSAECYEQIGRQVLLPTE
jgi:similar to stage IV sporulation protein